ncbi:acyl-CoA Delta-9 desaturase-like [Schistocerca gregaria]|uniref:acyl-CoA Delta-9 desaturase-like n=1 Tax=Schistocerca gregaria TaxID=7010 RepID=UPI00211EFA84|nr:acyl-CoA Delta-9 desaturase-like [Schistocerca gregaria]XP_049854419.1 acyl-CoA Delta-9 desaturase-like [Schistocerca gregaria]XP_049854420.1 acyl-CoA Delta-9 desaturase-like [Schistocerca gregaria]XP_049854421.1 acyl-CoA Delta-9 desaturase-like [Schistocerca gregaria]
MAPRPQSPEIKPEEDACARVDETPGREPSKPYVRQIYWTNVVGIATLHLAALWGMLWTPFYAKVLTILWATFLGGAGGFGVTAGAHRLWTHRAYKATWPARVILMVCYCIAGQNPLYDWVRDHRVHHKFSETDADPHNARRGFFFAHVGWLMMRKHPEVVRRGRQIDMSDILADPVVRFHQKYFKPLKFVLCFYLPVMIPVWLWGEDWYISLVVNAIIRYACSLNFTWLVNSAAHIWGNKPYDRRISPVENRLVAFLAMGEGWHNYHHAFPWDYKAAELGAYGFNVTTLFLDLFACLGMVYDRRVPSEDLVRRTALMNGDGSHPVYRRNDVTDLSLQKAPATGGS